MFLFNVGGYYFVFLGLRYSTYKELSSRIDQENSAEANYEFKVPLKLAYPIQETGYVRSYGEFEYNGEYYILAEQKLERDTLYIRAIKNTKRKHLNKAFTDYAKVSNDILPVKQKRGSNLLSKLIKDYKGHDTFEIARHYIWRRQITYPALVATLCKEVIGVPSPPPK